MANFNSASEYAERLLEQHKGDRRAAIAEVVGHHEVDKQLRRDAIDILKEGLPKWQIVFPHFPAEDMPDIPETWEDISSSNDACPSFMVMSKEAAPVSVEYGKELDGDSSSMYDNMKVWIAEADPEAREIPEIARFCVSYDGPADYASEFEFQSDDWQEVLHYVNERVELGARYKQVVGYNPFLDEPRITPERVRQTLKEYEEEAKAHGEHVPKL